MLGGRRPADGTRLELLCLDHRGCGDRGYRGGEAATRQPGLVVVFGPAADDWPSVYSNAEVRQLVPLLQSMLAKLVGGGLVRLPPTDGVRWIDADDPPAGGE